MRKRKIQQNFNITNATRNKWQQNKMLINETSKSSRNGKIWPHTVRGVSIDTGDQKETVKRNRHLHL